MGDSGNLIFLSCSATDVGKSFCLGLSFLRVVGDYKIFLFCRGFGGAKWTPYVLSILKKIATFTKLS